MTSARQDGNRHSNLYSRCGNQLNEVWLPASAFAKASADRRSFSGGWSAGRMPYAIAARTVARIFSIAVFRFSSALLAQYSRLNSSSDR